MKPRYYLEINEAGHRIPVGNPQGYETAEEAQRESLRHVDDALPCNTVHVMLSVGHAYLGGDGDPYYARHNADPA